MDTHPGLTFLKDAPEFHSRYITTVSIFMKGSITQAEVSHGDKITGIVIFLSLEHAAKFFLFIFYFLSFHNFLSVSICQLEHDFALSRANHQFGTWNLYL